MNLGATSIPTDTIVDTVIDDRMKSSRLTTGADRFDPATLARDIVAQLQETDPEVLDEWLYERAESTLLGYILERTGLAR